MDSAKDTQRRSQVILEGHVNKLVQRTAQLLKELHQRLVAFLLAFRENPSLPNDLLLPDCKLRAK